MDVMLPPGFKTVDVVAAFNIASNFTRECPP